MGLVDHAAEDIPALRRRLQRYDDWLVMTLETGGPYAQLGSSRAKTFSAIAEPVVLFVVFTVALLTGTDLPYALTATARSSAGQVVRPAHLLASAPLFMVICTRPAVSGWRPTPGRIRLTAG